MASGGPIRAPVRVFVNVAPVKSAWVIFIPVNTTLFKFAFVRSTYGPIKYPPDALTTNVNAFGNEPGGPIMPPDFTRGMADPENRAFVMFASVKYAPLKFNSPSIWLRNDAPDKSTPGPIKYPPVPSPPPPRLLSTTNRSCGGKDPGAGGPTIPPPLFTFMRTAFVNDAPLISSPVNRQLVKFTPLKSTRGPTIYAPNELSVMNTYGEGNRVGGPTVPPLFTFVKFVPEKSTPVTFIPLKLNPDRSAPAKLAPTIFASGPMIKPPLAELTIYLYAGDGKYAGGPIRLGPVLAFTMIAPVKFASLTSNPVRTQFVRFDPDKSTRRPTMYPPLELSFTNVYPGGSDAGMPRIPPLRALTSDVSPPAKDASCIFASVNTTPDKSVPSSTALDIFTPVPIMYPPYPGVALTLNVYAGGRTAGRPAADKLPDLRSRNFARVKFAPLKSAPVMADASKFAPLKSE